MNITHKDSSRQYSIMIHKAAGIGERYKYLMNKQVAANTYFWRTPRQQEIDYIEERGGIIYAYEFKWNVKAKAKFSKTFTQPYQPEQQIVNKNNFEQFLL